MKSNLPSVQPAATSAAVGAGALPELAVPEAATLVEVLHRRASEGPTDTVFTFLTDGEVENARLTLGELDRRARGVAAYLQGLGLEGERALLIYPSGLDFITVFFGCLYAGVVAVPVAPPRSMRSMAALLRLLAVVGSCRPRVALTEARLARQVSQRLRDLPALGVLDWRTTDDLPDGQEESWKEAGIDGSTPAFLQYTSGSTADPRGVVVSHRNLLHNLQCICTRFRSGRSSTGVSWLPHFHDMGLIQGMLEPVYSGYPMYLMSPLAFLQRPVRWLEAMGRYGVTVSGGPNFAFEHCVRKTKPEHRARLDLSTLRTLYNGAEPVFVETLDAFYRTFRAAGLDRRALEPGYGLAEATLLVSVGGPDQEPYVLTVDALALRDNRIVEVAEGAPQSRRLVACGTVGCGMEVAIVDPETRCRAAPDTTGEIWLSGPSVAEGYWDQPEATRETFEALLTGEDEKGPYLRTGDLGFVREGRLYVTGRLKDLIILDGSNHYPQDIERVAEESHPGLRPGCCVAFSVPVERVERLVIVAEVRPSRRAEGRGLDLASIVKAIRRAVAESLDLRVHIVQLLEAGAVPKTSSGKVRRQACRRAFLDGALDEVA